MAAATAFALRRPKRVASQKLYLARGTFAIRSSFQPDQARHCYNKGIWTMDSRYARMCGVALAILQAPHCFAGPCSQQIEQAQIQIDARLQAAAASGPTGQETTAATMHHQPTPKSLAEAEAKLGDISPETIQTLEDAMARARSADVAGDRATCEKALTEVKKALAK
jgi:hypothetical protein